MFFNPRHRDNYHNNLKRMILKEVKGLGIEEMEEVVSEIKRVKRGMKKYKGDE